MRVLLLCLIATAALATQWSIDQFVFATIAVDVAYINSTTAISAVVDPEGNAQILWTVDGGTNWGPVYQFDGARMYTGCAANNLNGNQSAVVSDIFSFQFTDTQAFEFKDARVPGGFKSQTVDVWGSGFKGDGLSFASVGMRWEDASNGVMLSHDQGVSFEFFNISALRTWARYGAFPSSDVWYVTAGHWPNDNSPPTFTEDEIAVSSALTYKRHPVTKNMYPEIARGTPERKALKAEEDAQRAAHPERFVDTPDVIPPPGWNAQIVKSTDGGNTWTSQFWNTSHFYFNQITCATDDLCVAVAESQWLPGKGRPKTSGIWIFQTTDGGAQWKEVFFQEADFMSMFGVTFVTDKIVWACGADLGSEPLDGFFWVSRDGGATWKHENGVKSVYPVQMSFLDAGHAWAVGPNDVQQSALLKYA